MLKLTPSRLRDFQLCPLRFKLLVLDGLGSKVDSVSPALSFGSSIHGALADLHRSGTLSSGADIDTLLRRNWDARGFTSSEEEGKYFREGISILQMYKESGFLPRGNILGVELFLSRIVKLENFRFEVSGKIDRLEVISTGKLEVLDYKTNGSGATPTPEQLATDLPTFLYYVLARLCYPSYPEIVIAQLNLRSLHKTVVEYTDMQRVTNKRALANLVAKITRGDFESLPDQHCEWCQVKHRCPSYDDESNLDELI